MSNFAIGTYQPFDSVIHRMDARQKFFAFVCLIVMVFLPKANWTMSYLLDGALLVFGLILMFISKMSFGRFLKSLSSLWFMLIFILIIYILIPPSNPQYPAFDVNGFTFYYDSLLQAGRIFLRLALMIMFSLVLTGTTKPLALTDALEWYMKPLTVLGFPSHIVAMTISLALRFIPTILEDAERIMNAQASRGVSFKHGSIFKRLRAVISLIIPLFVSSFVRSDELANAMECRGYDPKGKRTRYRKMSFSLKDFISLIVISALLAFFIYSSVTGFDVFALIWGITVI